MVDLAPNLDELGWCPVVLTTGNPCPTCGGTRAVMSLVRGDLGSALKFNGAVVVLIAALMVHVGVAVTTQRSIRILPRYRTLLLGIAGGGGPTWTAGAVMLSMVVWNFFRW